MNKLKADINKARDKGYKYYIYHLVNPKDNTTFYVGKGSNLRCMMHLKDAEKRQGCNAVKLKRIRDIGIDKVKINIIAYFKDENEAYNQERNEMQRIGFNKLTNLSKQQYKQSKIIKEQSIKHDALLKIINLEPFYIWALKWHKAGFNVTKSTLKLYWKGLDIFIKQAKIEDYRKYIRQDKYYSYNEKLEDKRPLSFMKLALNSIIID